MRNNGWLAGVVVGIALVPVLTAREHDAVQVAALRELLEAAPGRTAASPRSICVAVAAGNLSQWRKRRDPEPRVLLELQVDHAHVYPASRCAEDGEGVWDPIHHEAVLLSLGSLEWISSDFVKTEGYWVLDGLSGQGFRLTLSREKGRWQVDMAAPTWIS